MFLNHTGWISFGYLFFGHSKKSNSPEKAKDRLKKDTKMSLPLKDTQQELAQFTPTQPARQAKKQTKKKPT
ncbi:MULTISPECIES: hypothetical protein [Pseudomonas]|uniref:Uncharacterized protein n=1 Tax=Pseudomonas neustonica TaxID=2487346 RepID=A0ABX9XHS6_9PSED|nr:MULTISPECIES: hypothetical protein [Pseudomonas]MBA6421607.1 hypothetical protein [Pseudomonas sp. 5Ae-yellow]ROZ82732.1 hypothetical protein EF099_10900 [Pseudomonas sp. SSM44]ROZ84684.1 hypothetical protein EF096_09760 [Pseudomonas neustonica]|tara:strand:+ start:1268 stop:1480 length:213 start_codon:yes stop_codon:yes gene_type:complete